MGDSNDGNQVHSTIGVKPPNGEVVFVDCHYDGYVEHVGRILLEHYENLDKVIDLLNGGDILTLGVDVGNTTMDKRGDARPMIAKNVGEYWDKYGNMLKPQLGGNFQHSSYGRMRCK